MFQLLRNIIVLVMFIVLAYAACTVELGEKTFLGHSMDVWHSQVVQEKVAALKQGLSNTLHEQLISLREKGNKADMQEKTEDSKLIEDVIVKNL